MVSKELLDEVMALDEDDKLYLLRRLLQDPAMAKYAFDPMGLRSSYEAADKLMELLEEKKLKSVPSIE